jgi:hypothetical protein
VTRRAGRALLWLAALLAAGVSLRLASRGELATPPLGSFGQLTAWVDAREPAAAAVALVRLLAEVWVWYVLALSALHVASAAVRSVGGHRLADALALPGARRLVHAGLGLGLAAASSVASADPVATYGVATMTPVAEAPLAGSARIEASSGTAAMRPLPSSTGERGTAVMTPVRRPSTWTVGPGESFWSIAEELLADAWRRPPSDAEVDPFWRALVAANRARLVDPMVPDAIQPGQVFEVPPVPSAPPA